MMEKNGTKAIKEFTSLVHKEFGMRIVVLAAFVDRDGDPSMSLWVYVSVCFSSHMHLTLRIDLTTMTKMAEHLSRTVIQIGDDLK